MTRWEYKIEIGVDQVIYDQAADINRSVARHNAMGQEGWELVSVNGAQNGNELMWLAIYKRQL